MAGDEFLEELVAPGSLVGSIDGSGVHHGFQDVVEGEAAGWDPGSLLDSRGLEEAVAVQVVPHAFYDDGSSVHGVVLSVRVVDSLKFWEYLFHRLVYVKHKVKLYELQNLCHVYHTKIKKFIFCDIQLLITEH